MFQKYALNVLIFRTLDVRGGTLRRPYPPRGREGRKWGKRAGRHQTSTYPLHCPKQHNIDFAVLAVLALLFASIREQCELRAYWLARGRLECTTQDRSK